MLERTAALRVCAATALGELVLGFLCRQAKAKAALVQALKRGMVGPSATASAPSEYPGALREKERDTERQRDREGYIAVRMSRFNQLRYDRSTSIGGMMFHPPPPPHPPPLHPRHLIMKWAVSSVQIDASRVLPDRFTIMSL